MLAPRGGARRSGSAATSTRTDGRTVEELVLDRCRDRGCTLATAESCTGGLLAAALTAVPGSAT